MSDMWEEWSHSTWLLPSHGLCLPRKSPSNQVSCYGNSFKRYNCSRTALVSWQCCNGSCHIQPQCTILPKTLHWTGPHLTVGNGQNLPITYVGKVQFPTQHSSLHLNNVLRVPSIASNLASVHKLCHDNNSWCYFDENLLSVQALDTGRVLYQGRSEQSVYPIYPSKAPNLSLPSRVCNHVASTSSLWLGALPVMIISSTYSSR